MSALKATIFCVFIGSIQPASAVPAAFALPSVASVDDNARGPGEPDDTSYLQAGNSLLVVGTVDGIVHVLSAKSGESLWSFSSGGPLIASSFLDGLRQTPGGDGGLGRQAAAAMRGASARPATSAPGSGDWRTKTDRLMLPEEPWRHSRPAAAPAGGHKKPPSDWAADEPSTGAPDDEACSAEGLRVHEDEGRRGAEEVPLGMQLERARDEDELAVIPRASHRIASHRIASHRISRHV